jgi:hypothetical protein
VIPSAVALTVLFLPDLPPRIEVAFLVPANPNWYSIGRCPVTPK